MVRWIGAQCGVVAVVLVVLVVIFEVAVVEEVDAVGILRVLCEGGVFWTEA